jgi:hypothetical protein
MKPRKPPAVTDDQVRDGLNVNGCSFLVVFSNKRTPTTTLGFATLRGLRDFLAAHGQDEDRPYAAGDYADALNATMRWAAMAGPGLTEAFFEVMWIVTINAQDDQLLEYVDVAAARELGLKIRTGP